MSNGWYQLENDKRKRTPSHIAEYQYRETKRQEPKPEPLPEPKPVQWVECPTAPSVPAPENVVPPPAPCIREMSGEETAALPAEQAVPAAGCPEEETPGAEASQGELPGKEPSQAERSCVEEAKAEPVWERPAETLPDPYGDEGCEVHSQTVGPRGPVVLQDGVLHETLDIFVHEKLVERAVHVKGWGAFGRFETDCPMGAYTMLPFLQRAGQSTPTVTRFSLAVSTRGTPDTSRNVRGMSTKFYTGSGVFDLLCNHLPVFSVRDAMRFPESIKAFLPAPTDNLIDPDRFWAFVARAPESTNFVTWLYSDTGTLKSLRHLRAFGVNTYTWRNARGTRKLVKYHWLPKAGTQFITQAESVRLAGEDPDIAGRDLRDALARGERVEYGLCVQLMDPAEGKSLSYDPLDCTKVWDEEAYPLMPVGRLILERNPDDYKEQVEKLAFSPANLLEGAEISDDKMLQGRSFVYWDAQRYRLGPDFRKIPVNRQGDWTPCSQVSSGLGMEACGTQMRSDLLRRDDFAQAGERYRCYSPEEREHLTENIAAQLKMTPAAVRETVLSYFHRADPEYGRKVEEKMR